VSGRDGRSTRSTQAPSRGSRAANRRPKNGLLTPSARRSAKARREARPVQLNSEGACPNARGAGSSTPTGDNGGRRHHCEVCGGCGGGKRFDASVWSTHLGGATSARCSRWPRSARPRQVLKPGRARPPPAAVRQPGAARRRRVGTSPRTAVTTLFRRRGGTRLKTRHPMGEKGGVLILDEPTSGLQPWPTSRSCSPCSTGLRHGGSRVIVIEHTPGGHGARRLDHRLVPAPAKTDGQDSLRGTAAAPPHPTSIAARSTPRPQYRARLRRQLTDYPAYMPPAANGAKPHSTS